MHFLDALGNIVTLYQMGDVDRLSGCYLDPVKRSRLVYRNRAERLKIAATTLFEELDKKIKKGNQKEKRKLTAVKKNCLKKYNRKKAWLKERYDLEEEESQPEVLPYYMQTGLCEELERELKELYENYRGPTKDQLLVMSGAPTIDQMEASSGWVRVTGDVMGLGSTEAGKDRLESIMTALYDKRRESGLIVVNEDGDDEEDDVEGDYMESDLESSDDVDDETDYDSVVESDDDGVDENDDDGDDETDDESDEETDDDGVEETDDESDEETHSSENDDGSNNDFDRMMGYVKDSIETLQREIDEETEEAVSLLWTPPK